MKGVYPRIHGDRELSITLTGKFEAKDVYPPFTVGNSPIRLGFGNFNAYPAQIVDSYASDPHLIERI